MYMTSAENPHTQNSALSSARQSNKNLFDLILWQLLGERISRRKLVPYLCVKSVVLVFVLKMRFFGHVLHSTGIQESLSNLYSLKNNNPKIKVFFFLIRKIHQSIISCQSDILSVNQTVPWPISYSFGLSIFHSVCSLLIQSIPLSFRRCVSQPFVCQSVRPTVNQKRSGQLSQLS